MCGGEGTRLRPLTFERPKPSIPILNKPSVVHLIEHLANQGFNDIVITLGYMAEKIEEQLGDGRAFGVNINYVYEDKKLGTAGGVKNAEKYLKREPFLVLGGDHVLDLNLRELYRFHEKINAKVSIALLSIDDPREFGIADMDVNNNIHRFLEKPGPGEIFSNLASTGIYMCNPEILDMIPENETYDFARDLFPKLLEKGEKIKGILARGNWTDVGSPAAYRLAQRWMLSSLGETLIEGSFTTKNARINGPLQIGHNVSVGSNSGIVGPVMIGENTIIGDNVLIGPYTTIGTNCIIKDDTRILSSYIFNDIRIGINTNISGSIIDNRTVVGNNCSLENGTVLGPDVKIGNGSTIHSNIRIWPKQIIKKNTNVTEDVIDNDY